MRLVCKICGRVFERPYFMGESDFCSEKCRKKFLKTLPPTKKKPADKPFDFHKEIEKIRKAREYQRKYDAKKRLEKKQNENH